MLSLAAKAQTALSAVVGLGFSFKGHPPAVTSQNS